MFLPALLPMTLYTLGIYPFNPVVRRAKPAQWQPQRSAFDPPLFWVDEKGIVRHRGE